MWVHNCANYVGMCQQIAHATYVGPMCTMWPMQTMYQQCEYQQIAHATYVGSMCTMWVPTNCPCNQCRPYVHNVGTNKLPMQPM